MAGKKLADSMGYDPPADRHRVSRKRYGYKGRGIGPSDEDRLRWQRFLDELPERIARIRAEAAPLLCPTCGSTTPKAFETKACVICRRSLPLAAFNFHRSYADGRDSRCKECRSELNKRDAERKRKRLALMAVAS